MIAAAPMFYFSLHTQLLPVFGFSSYQRCGVTFFGRFFKPEKSHNNPGYLIRCTR